MAAESALKFFMSMNFFDDGCCATADTMIRKENTMAEYFMVVVFARLITVQSNAAKVGSLRDLPVYPWGAAFITIS